MSEWRYSVQHDTVNNHTTITRGRIYNVGDSDSWGNYWDGDGNVAFYDEGFRGLRPVDGADEEDTRRATVAYSTEQDNLPGSEGALKRAAVRITENLDAEFICVPLDRGMDCYVLAWNGDESGDLRREIEAVWNQEVYRIETEEFHEYVSPYDSGHEGRWLPADDMCEEWYGEDNAEAALAQAFPETEFPADKVITDNGE